MDAVQAQHPSSCGRDSKLLTLGDVHFSSGRAQLQPGASDPIAGHDTASGKSRAATSMKTLVIFDLDGTLAESKASIDAEMADLLDSLLGIVKVSVISGGAWPQFQAQVLARLHHGAGLRQLFLLPTCGTKFYRYGTDWKQIYSEDFTAAEKVRIIEALRQSCAATENKAGKVWGDVIEDRGSQITFSALGQEAPLEEKLKWDPDYRKRKKMKLALDGLIPEFAVNLGGATSIDVTRLGIDKAYGIRKLRDILHIPIKDMIYIGDALFPGGNDYPAKQAGACSIQVRDPQETKRVIETIIACLEDPCTATGAGASGARQRNSRCGLKIEH